MESKIMIGLFNSGMNPFIEQSDDQLRGMLTELMDNLLAQIKETAIMAKSENTFLVLLLSRVKSYDWDEEEESKRENEIMIASITKALGPSNAPRFWHIIDTMAECIEVGITSYVRTIEPRHTEVQDAYTDQICTLFISVTGYDYSHIDQKVIRHLTDVISFIKIGARNAQFSTSH
jgi:tellurite resistance-related uncharacterized protein